MQWKMATPEDPAFFSQLRAKFWFFGGRLEIKRKHYREALRYFEKVIRANPDSAVALAQAAFCLNHLQRIDEAFLAYDRAISIAPNFADAHAHTAQIHSKSAHNQEA